MTEYSDKPGEQLRYANAILATLGAIARRPHGICDPNETNWLTHDNKPIQASDRVLTLDSHVLSFQNQSLQSHPSQDQNWSDPYSIHVQDTNQGTAHSLVYRFSKPNGHDDGNFIVDIFQHSDGETAFIGTYERRHASDREYHVKELQTERHRLDDDADVLAIMGGGDDGAYNAQLQDRIVKQQEFTPESTITLFEGVYGSVDAKLQGIKTDYKRLCKGSNGDLDTSEADAQFRPDAVEIPRHIQQLTSRPNV